MRDFAAGSVPAAVRRLARAWGDVGVAPWPRLGFSGAPLFRLTRPTDGGQGVLKPFPPSADRARAEWVHGLMLHARVRGAAEVPEPLATRGGETVVAAGGRLWECVGLVPGAPIDTPTADEAAAAARALARLHAAVADFAAAPARLAESDAVRRRIDAAARLRESPWASRPPSPAAPEAVAARRVQAARVFAAHGGERALERIAGIRPAPVRQQAVLRDVWSDHVLFAGSTPARVTGIVDYHAAAVDTPAADLARLFGSWPAGAGAGSLASRWPGAFAAYERVRPLGVEERRLAEFLHASGMILGLDNWFRWVLDESREFPQFDMVVARIDRLLEELPGALETLADDARGPCGLTAGNCSS